MDIARPDLARRRKFLRNSCAVVTGVVLTLTTMAVSRLQPAAPRVDRDAI